MRIATPVNRSLVRNDRDFCKGCGARPGGRPRGSPLRRGYKRCGAGRNPPVTASPCQPPLGKGARGTGGRIATASVRTGFAMTVFCMECGAWQAGDREGRPYGELQGVPCSGRGRTPPLRRGYKECDGAGRCGHRPLRMRYKGCNGRTEASAPTDTSIDNCQWPVA